MMINFSYFKPFWIPLGIFCLNLLTRLVYFGVVGVRDGGDSWFYVQNAQVILDHSWNPLALLHLGIYPYYWLYPFFLALLQIHIPLLIVTQIILQALAGVLLFLIGKTLWRREVGWLAGVAYALFFEVWQWDTYVLTDSLFVFILIASVYAIVVALEKRTLLAWVVSAISVVAAFFLRPTSVVYVACVALLGIMLVPMRFRIYAASLAIVVVAVGGWYLTVFGSQQAFGVAYSVRLYTSTIMQGMVVRDRPEYSLHLQWDAKPTLKNAVQVVALLEHRAVAFWRFYIPAHSLGHRLLNVLTFVPLYVLGIIGCYRSFDGRVFDRRKLFLVSIIVAYWVFHTLTEVDYDWRYRIPVLPWVLLFASYGAVLVFERYYPRGKVAL